VTRVPAHPDWFGCLPHLLHSTTDLTRPARVRANVDRSGSDPEGTTFVWGGPCAGRFSHTKWATFFRPLPGQMADLAVFCPRGPAGHDHLAGPAGRGLPRDPRPMLAAFPPPVM
jgi:hypothetical protein